jgi:small-conductance mechanosensitive channel
MQATRVEELITQAQGKWGLIGIAIALLAAVVIAYCVHYITFKALKRWSRRSEIALVKLLDTYLYSPSLYVLILLTINFTVSFSNLPYQDTLIHILTLFSIAATTYLLIQGIAFAREALLLRYDLKAVNNLEARKIYTQFKIIERILVFVIIILAISVSLMTFEKIRQVGVSLLASAGIIGIIVGFAAQKSLGTILAGVQIAIAQPIRIDDAVVIEGEFGRVEEIKLTYVVIKIWDERRLIVPINYFIEKSFQNWTRTSTELTGSVFLYTDYLVPIEAMRMELDRILSETTLWDKRTKSLVITDANANALQVRILVSASNSGELFDLRCLIREKMITFLQKRHPESLPRTRLEMPALPTSLEDISSSFVNAASRSNT